MLLCRSHDSGHAPSCVLWHALLCCTHPCLFATLCFGVLLLHLLLDAAESPTQQPTHQSVSHLLILLVHFLLLLQLFCCHRSITLRMLLPVCQVPTAAALPVGLQASYHC